MDYRERNYYLVGLPQCYEYPYDDWYFVQNLKKYIPSIILRPVNDRYFAIGRSLGFYPTIVISCRKEYTHTIERLLRIKFDDKTKRSMFRNCRKLTKEILGQ
jgi:hypothetical protein